MLDILEFYQGSLSWSNIKASQFPEVQKAIDRLEGGGEDASPSPLVDVEEKKDEITLVPEGNRFRPLSGLLHHSHQI